jgi:hypothetical protein
MMALRRLMDNQEVLTVDPSVDEIVLKNRKDRPDCTYYARRNRAGTIRFYAYRLGQRAYGEHLSELCVLVPHAEVQAVIDDRAIHDRLAHYADEARLLELGFTIPGNALA